MKKRAVQETTTTTTDGETLQRVIVYERGAYRKPSYIVFVKRD